MLQSGGVGGGGEVMNSQPQADRYQIYASTPGNSFELRIEAEFLDIIGTKVFKVLVLAIHSHEFGFCSCRTFIMATRDNRSQIHERTISLRFRGIIFSDLVSINKVYITHQFHTTFARGMGGGGGMSKIQIQRL
jgi:hypothetical protein